MISDTLQLLSGKDRPICFEMPDRLIQVLLSCLLLPMNDIIHNEQSSGIEPFF